MSYATMQDVSFALVTDCELPDRATPRTRTADGAGSVAPRNPQAAIKPKAASTLRARSRQRRGLDPAETYGPLGVL
jgi:hypothetical protein